MRNGMTMTKEPQPQRMKDVPEAERPREKLLARGAEALSDAELVAILLRTGIKGCNVCDLAKRLLENLTGLDKIRTWDSHTLKTFIETSPALRGIGKDKLSTLLAAFEIGFRIYAPKEKLTQGAVLTPAQAVSLIIDEVKHLNREAFWAIYLDKRRRPIEQPQQLTLGIGAQTLIDPKTLFRRAVLFDAYAVIILHNHPSGNLDPSEADISTTRALIAAGKAVNIPLIDHIIVCPPGRNSPHYHSLRSHNDCIF
jgi:DNA repair protein RadC